MGDELYEKLAKVLDTLPNGFPPTKEGVEIKLLKKVFSAEQAEIYCNLRLEFENAEQIAARSGLPLEGLEEKLRNMMIDGQVMGIPFGDTFYFQMRPWLFGIWEFQLNRLDREMVDLFEQYHHSSFGKQFFTDQPQQFRILPIEEEIKQHSQALPYEKVSSLIDAGKSFLANDCICKKEKAISGDPCDRPMDVCLAVAPIEGVFDNPPSGKVISQQEAYDLLKKTEEMALVHLTSNFQNGVYYICNCCSCCCAVLAGINKMGIPATSVVNSNYFAVVNEDNCTLCGTCKDERCQVDAIEEGGDSYRIVKDKCIGCGLCISTCEDEAIQMVRKEEAEIIAPPVDEKTWFIDRGKQRGVDFSEFLEIEKT